jgi:dTDP-4-amino-4,6-dideoxygalactose transaminase
MTFVATAQAVVQAGATPVLVDVDSETWNIDPSALELELIRGLDAVVPVHLHGRLAEMNELRELTQKHGVPLFEDAAQAAGARNRYGNAGSFGIAGAFSFYPGKNLGALGEGGALVTNNDEIAEYARLYRNWGAKRRYEHDAPGTNLRMSELMGGLLSIKLPHLPEWIAHRQQVAHWYEETLSSLPVLLPSPSKVEHAQHVYAIRVENRNKIEASLTADGIEVGIHYPRPIHLNEMFAGLGYTKGDFPVSEWLAEGFLSLPMDEYMTRNEVDRVSSSLRRALGESA